MARYADLSDAEREKYNLPPQGFQGNEMTVVIQAPSKAMMTQKIEAFHKFAIGEKYENFQVLSETADPDGGFKAIVQAHNFNPITWASEQLHRAKLGATEGWEQGRKKATIKHHISQQGELASTAIRETALQKARVARNIAAGTERQITEEAVGREKEITRRENLLAGLQSVTPDTIIPTAKHSQPMNEYIFGNP